MLCPGCQCSCANKVAPPRHALFANVNNLGILRKQERRGWVASPCRAEVSASQAVGRCCMLASGRGGASDQPRGCKAPAEQGRAPLVPPGALQPPAAAQTLLAAPRGVWRQHGARQRVQARRRGLGVLPPARPQAAPPPTSLLVPLPPLAGRCAPWGSRIRGCSSAAAARAERRE